MKNLIDWNRRAYLSGTNVEEHCRNEDCTWRIIRSKETGFEELEICPVCGTKTDCSISFGGLVVRYNRVMDNFTLMDQSNRNSVHVDCADCPDTILFMLKHYRFDGWAESVIKQGEL